MPRYLQPTSVLWDNSTNTVPTSTSTFAQLDLDLADDAVVAPPPKPPVWTLILVGLVAAGFLLGVCGLVWAVRRMRRRSVQDDHAPLESTNAFQLPPLNLGGSHGMDSFAQLTDVVNDTSASSIASDKLAPVNLTQYRPRPSSSVYSRPLTDFDVLSGSNSPGTTRPASLVSNRPARSRPRTYEFFNPTFFSPYRGDL
ncbi:hypothetical protein EV426DRAFT_710861 [Tirmania nivea]|nr:hypothetical protein EV426DRAFT_710861 [Tirmania nivea]